MSQFSYFEFFAGGGMARAGLGASWRCAFANDFDPMKAAAYAANWGADHLLRGDIANIAPQTLPGHVDLAWASFPCQDLSLAGAQAGLGGAGETSTRSGTFWPFLSLMRALREDRRAPRLIVLENVHGILTSNGGRDFAAIGEAIARAGYVFGAMLVDAIHFVPQSRPRVFVVAVDSALPRPESLLAEGPSLGWHPKALVAAVARLGEDARKHWLWWRLPAPPRRNVVFADLVEERPEGVRWHSPEETRRLLGMMAPTHLAKVEAAQHRNERVVGALYRRTRRDLDGAKRQRAEARFDDVAGCLRTPRGGSSRQTLIVVQGESVRTRLLSPREAARLMGLDDEYRLPARYNDAYHVAGDGVCVPAVRHLAAHLLEPLLRAAATNGARLAAE